MWQKIFGELQNGDSKRNELRLWQTNSSSLFFSCLLKNWRRFRYSVCGLFFRVSIRQTNANLMTSCISKELHIKEKNEKMIHDRGQRNVIDTCLFTVLYWH